MASVTDIREALAVQLRAIPGLRVQANEPDSINPPSAAVGLQSLLFDRTFGRGHDELQFVVRLYASRADDRAGQRRLDSFIAGSGASSVKEAIEVDLTLGGTAIQCRVTGVDNYGVYEVAGTPYYGAEFAVTVWARGI
jgi:hypothetical protein